ncbi:MAG: PIG-L deacetylase family protein [Chitinophagaceae bacterium]
MPKYFYSLNTAILFFHKLKELNKKCQKRLVLLMLIMYSANAIYSQSLDKQARIIVIGAHPDDCDQDAGGTSILFASMGHAVKFLSVTNGDAGHQSEKGTALAKRRFLEAQEAGKRFGVAYDVLDNHDGQLLPGLAVRLQIIRKIREWNADIVISPRPNDYHPDHRYTGILVQDAAYMVAVPNVAPGMPPLKNNPLFIYFQDNFQRPNPFRPDIAIDISEVYAKKIYAMDAHQSQMYEWLPWIGHYLQEVPKGKTERLQWLEGRRKVKITPEVRKSLQKWYGEEAGTKVEHAEAFEICEYGTQPNDDNIRRLFPMLK